MKHNPFGVLYCSRPELVLHETLKNSGAAARLLELARSKGYAVSLSTTGGFVSAVRLHEGTDSSAPMRNHSIRSATRFLEEHPGID